MREIKFRVWDFLDGKWDEPKLGLGVNQTAAAYFKRDGHKLTAPRADVILMEFTGMKDKYGKEIYENDIVEVTNASGISSIVEVVYAESHGSFMARSIADGWTCPFGDTKGYTMEVVGNSYENPELLEHEDDDR